jgi:hypothetical protein
MAKKSKKTETAEKPEVIQGDDRGKDVAEQTMEARGIDPNERTSIAAGKAGSAASQPPLTPEMKARDAQIEEREEFLREQGADPDTERNSPGGGINNLKKVEAADTSSKQYRGMVTVSGIHGQTHEKVSCRIDLPTACGEEYVHYAFFSHHPAAVRDVSTIVIDSKNETDPNLRSHFE